MNKRHPPAPSTPALIPSLSWSLFDEASRCVWKMMPSCQLLISASLVRRLEKKNPQQLMDVSLHPWRTLHTFVCELKLAPRFILFDYLIPSKHGFMRQHRQQ